MTTDMHNKKTPMRMCIGCGQMYPKSTLTRIVKTPEGDIKIDCKGKMNGRGAYICKNTECLNKSVKTKKLERTFSSQISGELYDTLKEELSNA